jgi:hypothetical protein
VAGYGFGDDRDQFFENLMRRFQAARAYPATVSAVVSQAPFFERKAKRSKRRAH